MIAHKIELKPKFKKKGKSKDSFYIGGDQIKIERQKVKIPNLGWVKLREDIRFQGKILNATVSRIADRWFISFAIKSSMSYLPCKNQASVGIDLGIKKLSRQLSRKQHSRKKGDTTRIQVQTERK